jgi:hypothetical protein
MGCCCSKRKFEGEGHRLGTADEDRAARGGGGSSGGGKTQQQQQQQSSSYEPYTDKRLTDEERAKIREERLAAAEGRLTKDQKKQMKTKKKKPDSDEPLRGPNTQNNLRWTAG